jgi:hypothetical protein
MHEGAPAARRHHLLEQRCLLLCVALIALLVAIPLLRDTLAGRALLAFFHVAILLAAVAAVGRTRRSLLVAGVLLLPAFVSRLGVVVSGAPELLAANWVFSAIFYLFVVANLLWYVFLPQVISQDKLFGAVAAYIMIAIFWSYLHALAQYFYPGAYALQGAPQALQTDELIYFSFTVLTTSGFGDITPANIQARYLTILEMLVGVMFVAILIARLIGVYPGEEKKS